AEHLLLAARGEDVKGAAACAEIDFPVGYQGGSPGFSCDLVGPTGSAGLRVHTMEYASAIGDECEALVDRRCTHDVLLQRVGPNEAIGGNVARAGGVNALEPRLILAPPDVTTAGHINPVVKEDRHA